jgi:hypothetical protein
MGAALHLAHVHQAPPGPKRKRKDGDDGGSNAEFGRLASRIYQDARADHEAKELLLAVAYALHTPHEGDTGAWTVAREALGQSRAGRWRIAELVARDAPCYKSPAQWSHRHDGELYQLCSAPRLRPYKDKHAAARHVPAQGMLTLDLSQPDAASAAAPGTVAEQQIAPARPEPEEDFRNRLGVCGSDATEYEIEKLPDTGWHKVHWFCSRHQAERRKTRARLQESNAAAPAPVPNWGGLLPCYFDSDWERVYRHYLGQRWQPPVYGMRADSWPVPGVEPVPQRARLRLAALDGELIATTEEG